MVIIGVLYFGAVQAVSPTEAPMPKDIGKIQIFLPNTNTISDEDKTIIVDELRNVQTCDQNKKCKTKDKDTSKLPATRSFKDLTKEFRGVGIIPSGA
jgi:hypothetical protein